MIMVREIFSIETITWRHFLRQGMFSKKSLVFDIMFFPIHLNKQNINGI